VTVTWIVSNPADKAWHDKLVLLVERMLELHKRSPRIPHEQEMVKREIKATNHTIDKLVYELNGLTDDEIKIVDNKIPIMPDIALLVGEHCNHRAPSRVCAGRN
jgi:hypothetical protein